jgi:hypothetical protein
MEMSGEPRLDTPMFADQFDELFTLPFVTVVEPAAAVDDVILLQDAQSGSVRRGVSEDE